ncbi:MAG: TonB-dependent receptor plug domain-containing protein [Brevundimonas sp.]|uniref:TonB-dependent receptor plug domain-containing protein n=1 Tax=Brevundimonas sp. TaxID=1871086 RepID=UPI00391D00B1
MKFDKKALLASSIIAGLAMAAPSMALAQSQEDEDDQRPQPSSQQATQVGEVVITGSRIRRNEFTATQPIQVITAEQATLEGLADTSEILQGSTAANTATQINNFFTGFVTTGGPGVNTISLRGLGAQRTLVLVNGRRVGPAGVRGQVGPADLNTIPGSQIERVEILTDGASSIYGSDAVAGVINIITRTNLDGGRAEVFYSQPLERGGEELRANIGQGWTFDRGYVSVAGEFYRRSPLRFGDRDWFDCPQAHVYRDPNYQIRADVIDPETGEFKCQSVTANVISVWSGPRAGTDFMPDPSAVLGGGPNGCDLNGLRQVRAFFIGGGFNGAGQSCAVPGTAPAALQRAMFARTPAHSDRYGSRTAVSPVDRYSISAFAGYDLTPTTEIFGEFLFNRRESEQNSWRQIWGIFDEGHPANPYPFDAEPTLLLNTDQDQQVDYYRGVAGIRGQINAMGGWDWELAAQYSRSRGTYGGNFFYADRFEAALDPSGCDTSLLTTASSCPVGGLQLLTNDAVLFGRLRPEDEAFLIGYEQGTTTYTHAYVEGIVTGNLFNLPAGPLGAAFGFQIRREEIDDNPGEQARNGNSWGQSSAGRTTGSDTVREVFAEFEVPVIRSVPLIDSLSLNLSGRYSDYDSYGDNTTYKVGLNWQITPAWRIRASQGTSFRAPALYELFLANQTSFLGQAAIDPCRQALARSTNPTLNANCLAAGVPEGYGTGVSSSALIITGGGIGILNPETAEAQSIGLIWTPAFVDLSVALDYYKIEVQDEVRQFGAANIVSACYFSDDFANEPLCSLIVRNPPTDPTRPSEIVSVNDSYVNIARQESEGLDLTIRYAHRFGFGDLTLNGRFTHILNWESQLFNASAPTQNHQRIGSPDFVGQVSARFDRGDWTYFWNTDIVGETSNADFLTPPNSGTYFGEPVFFKRFTDHHITHGFSIRRRADQWTLQAGVNNVFNTSPPITSASGGGTRIGNTPLASQYDWIGRRVFFNISRAW